MKKPFLFFMSLALCVATACSDDNEKRGIPDNDHTTTLPTAELNFNCAGGSQTFEIESNGPWSITNSGDWCTVDVLEGEGNASVTVTVSTYTDSEQTSGGTGDPQDRKRDLIVWSGNSKPNPVIVKQYSKRTYFFDEAGKLNATLSAANAKDVTKLTLSGKLNNSDLQTLKSMITNNKLLQLDMQNATIEEERKNGVTYPAGTFPEGTFQNCSKLSELVFPSSLTAIGANALSGCSRITLLTLPKELKTIGSGAFSGCSGFELLSIPGSVAVISDEAFLNCTKLQNLTLASGTTAIGAKAFSGCAVSALSLPGTIVSLGSQSFANCSRLTAITLPSSLTTVGEEAFKGCSKVESITIPASVATIGANALPVLSGLTVTLDNLQHIELFRNYDKLNIALNEGVTTIGNSIFEDFDGLVSIKAPTTITSIGESAFAGCTSLAGVVFYNNLTTIGKGAFSGCTGLTNASFSEGLRSIGDETFKGCDDLTINFPASLTTIGNDAFADCGRIVATLSRTEQASSLSSCPNLEIVLNKGITTIDDEAFKGIAGLHIVTLGESVTTIGASAFEGCTGLKTASLNEELTTIGEKAFAGIDKLEINIPAGVTSIADNAFSGCNELDLYLDQINFGKAFSNTPKLKIVVNDGVTEIPAQAFENWTGLRSISLGATIEYIKEKAFAGCTGLTTVSTNEVLRAIDSKAFSGCTGGLSIAIPAGARTIATDAFEGCPNLTITLSRLAHASAISGYPDFSLNLAGGLTDIPAGQFENATGLKAVTLPASIVAIGEKAFLGCTALKAVTCENETPPALGTQAFTQVTGSVLTVPQGKADAYKASGWNNYFSTIQ